MKWYNSYELKFVDLCTDELVVERRITWLESPRWDRIEAAVRSIKETTGHDTFCHVRFVGHKFAAHTNLNHIGA